MTFAVFDVLVTAHAISVRIVYKQQKNVRKPENARAAITASMTP